MPLTEERAERNKYRFAWREQRAIEPSTETIRRAPLREHWCGEYQGTVHKRNNKCWESWEIESWYQQREQEAYDWFHKLSTETWWSAWWM